MKRELSPEAIYRRERAKRDRRVNKLVLQARDQLRAEREAAKPRRGRPKKVVNG